jgi:hypothetical protein
MMAPESDRQVLESDLAEPPVALQGTQ